MIPLPSTSLSGRLMEISAAQGGWIAIVSNYRDTIPRSATVSRPAAPSPSWRRKTERFHEIGDAPRRNAASVAKPVIEKSGPAGGERKRHSDWAGRNGECVSCRRDARRDASCMECAERRPAVSSSALPTARPSLLQSATCSVLSEDHARGRTDATLRRSR